MDDSNPCSEVVGYLSNQKGRPRYAQAFATYSRERVFEFPRFKNAPNSSKRYYYSIKMWTAVRVGAKRCRQNARYPRANIQIIVEKGRSLNKKC